ncbi:MAG: hypothetical protein IJU05_01120 [Schwartzia sp.]|nr:hypothetical protein [Schwartzia sp. (in: firmicutes)]
MESSGGSRPAGGGRKAALIGFLTLALLVVFSLGWLWLRPEQGPGAGQAEKDELQEMGFVRLGKAAKKHPAYGTLLRLRGEQAQLADLLAGQEKRLLALTAPDAIKKPFDDAVEQKKRLELVKESQAFLERLAEAEKAKREETRALYEASRDEINAAYFNEIFNTQLKLDNADIMRLSEQTVADLKRYLEKLQRERGRHQYELYQKYEAEIRAFKEELARQHGVDLAMIERSADDRFRAEEMRKRSEAQVRNLDAIQKNLLDATELRMKMQDTKNAIRAKEQELAALESGMTSELASMAAKLAVRHHLSVVYASPMTAGLPMTGVGTDPVGELRVVGGTAKDLTEELTQEIAKAGKQKSAE